MITHCIDSHVLQACHILPYSQSHDNSLENGLLLRADIHILFDKKLITIDNDFNVRVSENIHSPKYRELNGKKIEFGEQLDISQIKNNLKALYEWIEIFPLRHKGWPVAPCVRISDSQGFAVGRVRPTHVHGVLLEILR